MKPQEFVEYILGKQNVIPWEIRIVMSTIPSNDDIIRNNAARIIHAILRDVYKIPDIRDENLLQEALKLKDLYDCRSCVTSIKQVYSRGIMKARYEISGNTETCRIFGGREKFELSDVDWEMPIVGVNIRQSPEKYL